MKEEGRPTGNFTLLADSKMRLALQFIVMIKSFLQFIL